MLYTDEVLWIVVVGFIIAFILAFGIGANDVANSFGTSVGAKVLTLTQACILATICEFLGAVLLGMKVSGTIRNGIIDASLLVDDPNGPKKLLLGYLSSLVGACIWLLMATFFRLPVSGSHSIVGAVMGFGLVLFGYKGIYFMEILKIVISWVVSPILSGIISVLFFFLVKKFVLDKSDGLEPALTSLPLIFGVCIIVNVFSILKSAPDAFKFSVIPMYGKIILSFGLGIICAICVKFFLNPLIRNNILRQMLKIPSGSFNEKSKLKTLSERICQAFNFSSRNKRNETNNDVKTFDAKTENFKEEVVVVNPAKIENGSEEKDLVSVINKDRVPEGKVYSFCQIVIAVFGSFAHGGNDVSNAIGPLIAIWLIGITGDLLPEQETPIYLLVFGGFGITVGLWVWGRRVIQTLGEDLTAITPSSGVAIELGSALTVLVASNIGIPVSTTHCKVGSVVLVGRFRSKENVNWKIMRNIVIAWLVTVPASAGISALCMYLLLFSV